MFSGWLDRNSPPFVHCASRETFDLDSVQQFSGQKDYGFYDINLVGTNSVDAIMDLFAKTMRFPSYFGRNWDALIDLSTDLSWDRHPGYVTVIENADVLFSYPRAVLPTFLNVCKAISLRWQSKEDEYGNEIKPVPFHFLLVGAHGFCTQIEKLLGSPKPQF
jgi:hypothetical protein